MRRAVLLAFILAATACSPPTGFTARERAQLELFRLPELPDSPSPVADDPGARSLGQRLFFDTALSGPLLVQSDLGEPGDLGSVSCNDCHDVERGGADPRNTPTSVGAGWTDRNSPSVLNAAYKPSWGWVGAKLTLVDQIRVPLLGAPHNATPARIRDVIEDGYKADYEALFTELPSQQDASVDQLNTVVNNVAAALEAYVRQLRCDQSPFDRYMAGDDDAMSLEAIEGAKLFVGAAMCTECHRGPLLSDHELHVVGVSASNVDGAAIEDLGAAKGPNPVGPIGAFATPTLRGVSRTAPYMHNGALTDLWEVLDFYNFGGHDEGYLGDKDIQMYPLGLDTQQMSDLEAFLLALEGQPVPSALLEPG